MASALMLSGCDDLFDPAIENLQNDITQMYEDQEYMRGILHTVYSQVPGYYDNSEYATDDAVTNQPTNNFLLMATGGWTNSSYNPLSQWTNSYNAIQYINLFLESEEHVTWSSDEEMNELFKRRLTGEAYGLRGMFYFYLLQSHAGFDANNNLLGVPIYLKYLTSQSSTEDFNLPRATFQECVEQIESDFLRAEELLPFEYADVADNSVPADFQSITTDASKYNNVMGVKARGLFNGLCAYAYRARLSLLAASPLYQDASNTMTWEDAANAAAAVIDYKGGPSGLASDGVEYYSASITDGISGGANPAEIIWRANKSGSENTQESQNFPPSLYGTGYMNPSQNLVDAFPMANGYPIDDPHSGYNDQDPYTGRDPRLALYIVTNGSAVGTSGSIIDTSVDNTTNNDGLNRENGVSTRTGYYLRKHLREDVVLNASGSHNGQAHYSPRIRYTEIFLNYAEAANEAWGPQGSGSFGFSAYDVIKAIRQRAGVGTDNGDAYLESIKGDQGKMRELIRNERRLELCFEGFRFWDIRRWGLPMNEPAMGMRISGGTYTPFEVETRTYQDYMQYGPVPYSEMLKFNALEQNQGW